MIDRSESSNLNEDESSVAISEPIELQRNQMEIDDDSFLSLQLLESSVTKRPDIMQSQQQLNQLTFVRDVAPYQNDGSSIGTSSNNEQRTQGKSVCIRPLQGSRINLSERRSTCVPEIKVCAQPMKTSEFY